VEAYRDNVEHPTWIHRVFHDPSYDLFRKWHSVVNLFIYLSCIAIALESVEELEKAYHQEFMMFEWFSVILFTLDYLGNIFTSKNRMRYIFSFWGMVDLLSILPTYLMLLNFTGVKATKILRILRVIRVLRVLKLARAALQDINSAKEGTSNPIVANLRIYFIALFSILMISSTLMYHVEGDLYSAAHIAEGQAILDASLVKDGKEAGSETFMPTDPISGNPIPEDKRFYTSIPTAMWWCIVTLTTTGYGDMYPVTVGGRIVAGITMFLGLVLFGMLMNIVGKTLMVLLFGEAVGHEHEKDHKPHPHEHHADGDRIKAAVYLLLEEGVINSNQAEKMSVMSAAELSKRLDQH